MGRDRSSPTPAMITTEATVIVKFCHVSGSVAPKAPIRGTLVRPLNPPVSSRHCWAICSNVSDSMRVSSPTTTSESRRRNAAAATIAEMAAPAAAEATSATRDSDGCAIVIRAVR